jgi:IMP dehydrogenase/GMP reductase
MIQNKRNPEDRIAHPKIVTDNVLLNPIASDFVKSNISLISE